jgi:hypothetical protein
MNKLLLYISIIIIYTLLIEKMNSVIINIYKNQIFKFIFLYFLCIYGYQDPSLVLLLALLYIHMDQEIKRIELLYNID